MDVSTRAAQNDVNTLAVQPDGAMPETLAHRRAYFRRAASATGGAAFTVVLVRLGHAAVPEIADGVVRWLVADGTDDDVAASLRAVVHWILLASFVAAAAVSLADLVTSYTAVHEVGNTLASERAAWRHAGKRLYEDAVLLRLRRGRCLVAVASSPPTPAPGKPFVLFVHGSMARLGQFDAMMAACAARGWGFLAYDCYGMGRSPKPIDSAPAAFSADAHLQDLLDVYAECVSRCGGGGGGDGAGGGSGGGNPIVVVAHSFGCGQALRLVRGLADPLAGLDAPRRGPGLPAALVLLGSEAGAPRQDGAAKLRKIFSLPLWLLRCLRPLLSSGFKKRAFHPRSLKSPALSGVLTYADALSGSNPMHICQHFYTSPATPVPADVLDRLRGALPPAWFVSGAGDQITPPAQARDMAQRFYGGSGNIPAGRVVVVEAAGHQVHEEAAAACMAILEEAVEATTAGENK